MHARAAATIIHIARHPSTPPIDTASCTALADTRGAPATSPDERQNYDDDALFGAAGRRRRREAPERDRHSIRTTLNYDNHTPSADAGRRSHGLGASQEGRACSQRAETREPPHCIRGRMHGGPHASPHSSWGGSGAVRHIPCACLRPGEAIWHDTGDLGGLARPWDSDGGANATGMTVPEII